MPAQSTRARLRILLLVLVPLTLCYLIAISLLAVWSSEELSSRADEFGDAMADQLAITVTDHLINNDTLSLNILLRNLLTRGHFRYAVVHDANEALLAQVGKRAPGMRIYTSDITFQNTLIGYLRIGLRENSITSYEITTTGLLLLAGQVLIVGLLLSIYWRHILTFITAQQTQRTAVPVMTMTSTESELRANPDTCWLVLKVRPDRLLTAHTEKLRRACLLYNGEMEDDLTVRFSAGDHVHHCLCCAMLFRELIDRIPGNTSFRAGVDLGDDEDTTPKHAAYLASIEEGQILVSQRVSEHYSKQPSGHLALDEYHHALLEGGAYVLTSTPDSLIMQQADHLWQKD